MANVMCNGSSCFDIVNPQYKSVVYTAAAATSLAIAAVLTPWEFMRIIGLTVLTGAGYGIANDMIACSDCIEYFTIRHVYDEKELRYRPIKTLSPTLNAIVWGSIATWHVCAIAGAILASMARIPIPRLIVKITAAQLAPYFLGISALTLVVAHVLSRWAQKKMAKSPYEKYQNVPLDLQAGWEACNTRALTGYRAVALWTLALSVAIVVVRIGLIAL